MTRRRRRKRRGHFCWSCEMHLPDERFSGLGHKRHLCKTCAKLDPEELAFRQSVRDINQLLTWDGRVRKKQRATFERYLDHTDARVRTFAEEVKAHDERLRRGFRDAMSADEFEVDRLDFYDTPVEGAGAGSSDFDELDDDSIPF